MISAILFYLTFIVNIALTARVSIVFIFVLYQFYYFFNPPTKWWSSYVPDIGLSFYIVLTLLILVVINWKKYNKNKIFEIPQFKYLMIVVALYTIASFYAVNPREHSIALDAILTATVIIILVYKIVDTNRKFDYILWGYIGSASYLGYYISQVGRRSGGRFSGAGMVDSPDANGVAAAVAPAIILCLYFFWVNNSWKSRIIFGVSGALLATAIVQIGSRAAFLGITVGAIYFMYTLYFSSLQRKNQKMSVVFLLIVGLIGVATVTDKVFWQRVASIEMAEKDKLEETETGSTRIYFWLAAIDMAKDYPFGVGSKGFISYSHFYIPQDINSGGSRNRAVHSTWFEVLTEIGYAGFIAFSGLIIYCLLTLKRAAKALKQKADADNYFKIIAIQASFLCFIVIMTFLNRLRAEILYWLILYSAVAYNIFVLKLDKLLESKIKLASSTP
jgi:hypothetical protein